MREDVGPILRQVCRVHDHEVLRVGNAVDDHVVHDRPSLVAEQAVARLAWGERGDVARHEPIDHRAGAGSGEVELPHVRQVEEAGAAPHRAMLGDDARVLDGHFITGEGDHLRAESRVPLVERRAAQRRRRGRH